MGQCGHASGTSASLPSMVSTVPVKRLFSFTTASTSPSDEPSTRGCSNSDTSSVSPGMAPIRYLPGMKISCPPGCTGRAKPNLPASFTSVHSTAFPVFGSGTAYTPLRHTTLFRSTSSSTARATFLSLPSFAFSSFRRRGFFCSSFSIFALIPIICSLLHTHNNTFPRSSEIYSKKARQKLAGFFLAYFR